MFKVKKLICTGYISSLKERPSTINRYNGDGEQVHNIEYHKETSTFIVDGRVLIPISRIQEVELEEPLKEIKK